MIIKCFKDDKEEAKCDGRLPDSKKINNGEVTFMNICDITRKCIALVNLDTKGILDYRRNRGSVNKVVADVIGLRTDEPCYIDGLLETLNKRYYPIKFQTKTVVNMSDIYKSAVNNINDPDVILSSEVDRNRIGLQLIWKGEHQDYTFYSSMSTQKLLLSTLKPKLKQWVADTRKMHVFIVNNKTIMKQYDKISHYVSIQYSVNLANVFSKSYFQSFRTFMSIFNYNKFKDILFDIDDRETVEFVQKLTDVGAHLPTYNLKGIKLSPSPNNASTNMLGTNLIIDTTKLKNAKLILAGIKMAKQTEQLERCLERTKLFHA